MPEGVAACPSCGASVATPPNPRSTVLFGILAGIGLGCGLAVAILVVDMFAMGSRSTLVAVVGLTYVAVAVLFAAGIAAFVRKRVLFGFLLVTAGIVVVLPAFAFGSMAFACATQHALGDTAPELR